MSLQNYITFQYISLQFDMFDYNSTFQYNLITLLHFNTCHSKSTFWYISLWYFISNHFITKLYLSLFAAFVSAKPEGRKTVMGELLLSINLSLIALNNTCSNSVVQIFERSCTIVTSHFTWQMFVMCISVCVSVIVFVSVFGFIFAFVLDFLVFLVFDLDLYLNLFLFLHLNSFL